MVFLIEKPKKKMPPRPVQNKKSSLLSTEENDQIFRLLGTRCHTLATSLIQLFQAELPQRTKWVQTGRGVLCFVKDNFRKNYFFRLYCTIRNTMIWEQELYNNMDYLQSTPFFHMFEGDDTIIGFNFANNAEARDMYEITLNKIEAKRRREDSRTCVNNNSTINITPSTQSNLSYMDKFKMDSMPLKTGKKHRDKICKADISTPKDFRHLMHVGFNPDTGLNLSSTKELDPKLSKIFKEAGISDQQLQDHDTRVFIMQFINECGGIVSNEEVPKPVTSRKPPPPIPTQLSTLPPVPATQNTPPPVPQRIHYRPAPLPPSTLASSDTVKLQPQTATLSDAPPPPPPPPLPSTAPPPLAPMQFPPQGLGSVLPDPRSKLLESIREGKALKPVDAEPKANDNNNDARGNLLSEIRQGRTLKPANEREIKPITAGGNDGVTDLAGALAKALFERSRAIHPEDFSDSDSDCDSNDDEWE